MSLPCWIKWVVSLVSGPVLVVLAFAVVAAAMVGLVFGLSKATDRVAEAVFPDPEKRARVGLTLFGDKYAFPLWGGVVGKTLGLFVAGGVTYIVGSIFMQAVFGCDECLPAFMQKSCRAAESAAAQDLRDRQELDRVCAAHPAWCKPFEEEPRSGDAGPVDGLDDPDESR